MPDELKGFVAAKQRQALSVMIYSGVIGSLISLGFTQFYWQAPAVTAQVLLSMAFYNFAAFVACCAWGYFVA